MASASPRFRLPSARSLACIVLLLLAASRLVHFLVVAGDPYIQFRVGDETHYHKWALAIADGAWARGEPFFTTPLYAYFLAGLYLLAGPELVVVRALNHVLGGVTILLVYLTARRLVNGRLALLAPVLYGGCLAPIYYESLPEKTALVLVLTAASLYLATRASQTRSLPVWLAAGVCTGIAALSHALLLVLLPAVWLGLVVSDFRDRRGYTGKALASFTGGCLLAISPATVHNYLQAEDFVLINSNAGQNFYIGNHARNSTGIYMSPPFSRPDLEHEEKNFRKEAERRAGRPLAPSAVSRFWFRQGWTEMMQAPRLSLIRFWRKLRWSLGNEEVTDTRNYRFYRERWPLLHLPLWGFGTVALFGTLGCLVSVRRKACATMIAFVGLFCLSISLFFVYGRYRLPLLVPLSILAAVLASRAHEWLRMRRYAALALLALASAPLGWFVYGTVVPGLGTSFFPDYTNQGNNYLRHGQKKLAMIEYEKAIAVRPDNHPSLHRVTLRLVDLYLASGWRDEAVARLEDAIVRHPRQRAYREKLAQILEE